MMIEVEEDTKEDIENGFDFLKFIDYQDNWEFNGKHYFDMETLQKVYGYAFLEGRIKEQQKKDLNTTTTNK